MTKQSEAPSKPLEELSDEELDRIVGGIIIYDTVGTPVARYHLESAWPAK
jgi:bacteriocin-like protein